MKKNYRGETKNRAPPPKPMSQLKNYTRKTVRIRLKEYSILNQVIH